MFVRYRASYRNGAAWLVENLKSSHMRNINKYCLLHPYTHRSLLPSKNAVLVVIIARFVHLKIRINKNPALFKMVHD